MTRREYRKRKTPQSTVWNRHSQVLVRKRTVTVVHNAQFGTGPNYSESPTTTDHYCSFEARAVKSALQSSIHSATCSDISRLDTERELEFKDRDLQQVVLHHKVCSMFRTAQWRLEPSKQMMFDPSSWGRRQIFWLAAI
eukprot:2858734-Amphidinium_carterae.1